MGERPARDDRARGIRVGSGSRASAPRARPPARAGDRREAPRRRRRRRGRGLRGSLPGRRSRPDRGRRHAARVPEPRTRARSRSPRSRTKRGTPVPSSCSSSRTRPTGRRSSTGGSASTRSGSSTSSAGRVGSIHRREPDASRSLLLARPARCVAHRRGAGRGPHVGRLHRRPRCCATATTARRARPRRGEPRHRRAHRSCSGGRPRGRGRPTPPTRSTRPTRSTISTSSSATLRRAASRWSSRSGARRRGRTAARRRSTRRTTRATTRTSCRRSRRATRDAIRASRSSASTGSGTSRTWRRSCGPSSTTKGRHRRAGRLCTPGDRGAARSQGRERAGARRDRRNLVERPQQARRGPHGHGRARHLPRAARQGGAAACASTRGRSTPIPFPVSQAPTQKVRWPNIGMTSLPALESALDRRFRKGIPVWITEYGNETRPGEPRGVTEAQQAAYLPQAVAIARRDPRVADVRLVRLPRLHGEHVAERPLSPRRDSPSRAAAALVVLGRRPRHAQRHA